MSSLHLPTLTTKEVDKLVAKACKGGVHRMLELMDKWLSNRALVSHALSKILTSPLDPVRCPMKPWACKSCPVCARES